MPVYPTVSIISVLYNTELWLWERTLRAIASQEYPKENIEHIVMDGGSTNGARELARRFGCRVYTLPQLLHHGCARSGLGIQKAKGDLLLILEPDNIIVGKRWLKEMVQPFRDVPNIVGTYSARNTYEENMPALTRYFSLIGINDPLVYYLGKSEKLSYYEKSYRKGEILTEAKGYYVVRFSKSNLPTLGDNGHMIRRKALLKVIEDPYDYIHTDGMAKLLDIGCDTYGVVKNSIIHYSGGNIWDYIRRRAAYKSQNYDSKRTERRYLVYDPTSIPDRRNLIRFIIYSFSVFPMILESLWGYLHKKDSAWFLHPVICFVVACSYGFTEVSYRATHSFKKE